MKTIIGIIYIVLGLILIIDGIVRIRYNDMAIAILNFALGGYLILTQYLVYRKTGKLGPICCCGSDENSQCSINQKQKTL